MNLDKIYSSIIDNKNPATVESLGWSSQEAQQIRFKVISEIGIREGDSVLDVGCGYGDFSEFVYGEYLGIDLRSQATSIARKKYKLRNFKTSDVFSVHDKYDWVIASGIFCFENEKWEEETIRTLEKMYELCNKGVAVNFLSSIADFQYKGMRYVRPEELFKLFINLTLKFSIRHDYEQDDFTIYLYK